MNTHSLPASHSSSSSENTEQGKRFSLQEALLQDELEAQRLQSFEDKIPYSSSYSGCQGDDYINELKTQSKKSNLEPTSSSVSSSSSIPRNTNEGGEGNCGGGDFFGSCTVVKQKEDWVFVSSIHRGGANGSWFYCSEVLKIKDKGETGENPSDESNFEPILDTPSTWASEYDPQTGSITLIKPSGKLLHFRAPIGSSTANRVGSTQQYTSLVQLLNAAFEPIPYSPTGVQPSFIKIVFDDESSICFSVSTGKVIYYTTSSGFEITTNEHDEEVKTFKDPITNKIRKIWAVKSALYVFEWQSVDFTLKEYKPSDVQIIQGEPTPTGDPIKTTSFVTSSSGSAHTTTITEKIEGQMEMVTTRTREGKTLTVTVGTGPKRIVTLFEHDLVSTVPYLQDVRETIFYGDDPTPAYQSHKFSELGSNGWREIKRIDGAAYDSPDNHLKRVTQYYYDYDSPYITREVISWGGQASKSILYHYDSNGRLYVKTEWAPYSNGNEKKTFFNYLNSKFNDQRLSEIKVEYSFQGANTTLQHTKYSYEETAEERIEKEWEYAERYHPLSFQVNQLFTTRIYYKTSVNNYYAKGRIKMIEMPNGQQTFYFYEASNSYGAVYRQIQELRAQNEVVPGKSEKTIDYYDNKDHLVCKESYVHTGTDWSLINKEQYEYDHFGKLTKTTKANGRVSSTEWMCCGPLRTIDEDGIITQNSYADNKQLVEIIRSATQTNPETIISYTRDAQGKVLTEREDKGPRTKIKSFTYDILGRISSETDELGRTTTHTYTFVPNTVGETIHTKTTPTGETFITHRWGDGSLKSISGTGQEEVRYEHEIFSEMEYFSPREGELHYTAVYKITEKINVNQQWKTRRVTKTTPYGFVARESSINNNGEEVTQAYFYGINGLLKNDIKIHGHGTDLDSSRNLYYYDTLGNKVKEVMEVMEQWGAIIRYYKPKEYAFIYKNLDDGIYRETISKRQGPTGNWITEKNLSLISKLSSSLIDKTIIIDPRGNETKLWSEYISPQMIKQKSSIPTSNIIGESTIIDGILTHQKTTEDVSFSKNITYTSTGKTIQSTDQRGKTTTNYYDIVDRIVKAQDELGIETIYEYEGLSGQVTKKIFSDGTEIIYQYDTRGRLIEQTGNATYRVTYAYDKANRLISLSTYKDESSLGDTTEWKFNPINGLLLSEKHANQNIENFTYDNFNRPFYGKYYYYEYNITNEIIKIDFYGGMITYNDYGYVSEKFCRESYSDKVVLSYNEYGELSKEQYNYYSTPIELQISYDNFGRIMQKRYLFSNTQEIIYQLNIIYDDKGMIESSSAKIGNQAPVTVTNQYISNTYLPSTQTYHTGLIKQYGYEEERLLLNQLSYLQPTLEPLVNRTQEYNNLRLPIQSSLTDILSTRYKSYTYNNKRELIQAYPTPLSLQTTPNYQYEYDGIGNRTMASEMTSVTNYITNLVNQYTTIIKTEPISDSFSPEYNNFGVQTKIKTNVATITIQNINSLRQPTQWAVENSSGSSRDYLAYDCYDRFLRFSYPNFYLYDGYKQICMIDGYNTVKYGVLWDPLSQDAKPLAILRDGKGYACCHDFNKNVTELIELSDTPSIVATYDYAPYGEIIATTGQPELCPFRFSSEFYDEETGLIYYHYRFYNPTDGRFISRDPAGESASINLYAYVNNSPYAFTDHLGLWRQVEGKEDLWIAAGNNDSLEGLAEMLGAEKENWQCIWPVLVLNEKNYPAVKNCDVYDASNLSLNPPKNELYHTILDWYNELGLHTGQIYGVNYKRISTNEVLNAIKIGAKEGSYPITKWIIEGHGASGSNSLSVGENTFSFSEFDLYTDDFYPTNYKRAKEQKGPLRCWFSRTAEVRFSGCNSGSAKNQSGNNRPSLAEGFANKALRKTALAYGATHKINIGFSLFSWEWYFSPLDQNNTPIETLYGVNSINSSTWVTFYGKL